MTEKKWKVCTQRLVSAKRKFFFVIFVSCQQGGFEQDFQFWTLGRPKNVNYIITICFHWCEIPVQKTLWTTYFTTSDTLEIRQIPSPLLVPTGPSSETSGEHEKTHGKWRYYPWNEIKACFSRKLELWCYRFFVEGFLDVSENVWVSFYMFWILISIKPIVSQLFRSISPKPVLSRGYR